MISHLVPFFPQNRSSFNLVRNMMYGFGDDPQPYAESVDLLEDLVIQYITDMVRKTLPKPSN